MKNSFSLSFPLRAWCVLATAGTLFAGAAQAAIVPDRTRVIFNEGEQAAIVTITVSYIALNLLVDVLCVALDPRLTPENA